MPYGQQGAAAGAAMAGGMAESWTCMCGTANTTPFCSYCGCAKPENQ